MSLNKRVTTINCMDGRVQLPVIKYLCSKYNVDYVDSITEAGADKFLAMQEETMIIDNIKKRVCISVDVNESTAISIVGHYDCRGNPVDEETHKNQIKKSVEVIKSWNIGVDVIGLWVDENWEVHEINCKE